MITPNFMVFRIHPSEYFETPSKFQACFKKLKKKKRKWLTVEIAVPSKSICCCCLVVKSCPTLCNPMDGSMPGFPVLHSFPEFAQTHIHWVDDAIQPSHALSPSSPPALNLSQHQGLFQWVDSSHHVAKVLELQHQSFQWTFRVDFL